MASYAKFLGRRVTVTYRVGDVLLPASGTFVADSGRSIFLEQHVEQRTLRHYFRWEIPYQFVHRIAVEELSTTASDAPAPSSEIAASREISDPAPSRPNSMAAGASSGASALLPLSHRPKTA